MTIILIDKKSSLSKPLSIGSEFVNTTLLKKFAATELNCHPSELKIYHLGIDLEYREDQIVKQGEKIEYLIQSKSEHPSQTEVRKKGIVYPDELQKIIQNSKIIIIKSANEENIQKSKQHSLWATTFANQEKLKYFFNHYPNVILMFATNRSFQIKGLARMESEPDKITDKSVWAGVSNIRLGGNFKIKWLRKKPLSLVSVQKNLGANFKEIILKSCDGQELDPFSCKKLAHHFDVPTQAYYEFHEQTSKEAVKPKPLPSDFPVFNGISQMKFPPLPQTQYFKPDPRPSKVQQESQNRKIKNYLEKSSSSSEKSSSQSQKKRKKIKKQRRKEKKHRKSKKQHKKHGKSSSSSDSSSSYSESSSESERRKRKGKKEKKHKRSKKHKKGRS